MDSSYEAPAIEDLRPVEKVLNTVFTSSTPTEV